MYGCESYTVTLREELRLRVFASRLLWRISGPKRDEVTEEGKKSFVLLTKYYSDDQIEKNELNCECSMNREVRDAYRVFAGKPEGKRLLGRPRRRW